MNRTEVEQPLLTWNDLPGPSRPIIYDIIVNALPGRLIDNALFEGLDGPYLLQPLEESWCSYPRAWDTMEKTYACHGRNAALCNRLNPFYRKLAALCSPTANT